MDADRMRAEVNLLRCAVRGRLNRDDWTKPTIESAKRRGWIDVDGPWLHVTADGRDALARMEEGSWFASGSILSLGVRTTASGRTT